MSDQKAKIVIEAEDRFSRIFSAFDRTVKGSERAVTGLESRVSGLGLSLGALGAGFSFAAVATAVKNVADQFDALNDAADATGEKIEVLSGLEDVARRNGGSLEMVEDVLLKINKALADTSPDSEVARALRSIGLSADELRSKSPAEALQTIAKALAGFENNADASRVKMVLLGRSTKELAGYLNDVAEAGTISGRVTAEQARQAELFNKALAELSTNASNAGRGIVSGLLPALNRMATELRNGMDAYGSFIDAVLDAGTANPWQTVNERLTETVQRIKLLREQLTIKEGETGFFGSRTREKDIQALKDQLSLLARRERYLRAQQLDAGGGRGFVSPLQPDGDKPRISPIEPKSAKPQISEAMRYLQQLDKQIEKTQELSTYEQALRDIQANRLDGITPKLRADILARAQQLDLSERQKKSDDYATEARRANVAAAIEAVNAAKKGNDELEREVQAIGLTEAALVDLELARINETIARKEATIAGREETEQQLAINAALREEIAQLERRKQLLVAKVGKNAELKTAEESAREAAERLRNPVAESVAQGLLDGFRRGQSFADVFLNELKAQFARTILAPRIAPVIEGGNSLISQLLNSLSWQMAGGVTIDPTGYGMTSGGQSLPTRGGRANGGGVREGMAYRVGENGPEVFVPDGNGRIVPGSHLKSGTGQAPVVINQNWTVNGDVSSQTIAAMQAAIARNNQQLLRSMRTGGAFSSS